MTYTIRVLAPHFTAAVEVDGQRIVRAAPILAWTIGKRPQDLIAYVMRKGWTYDAAAA
jgi:hypothetical protein